jgi:glycerol-3-phosphate acyltransferase PlsY
LASLVMAISLPFYVYMLHESAFLPSMLLVTALIIIRHRSNIHKLLLGKEVKLGKKNSP